MPDTRIVPDPNHYIVNFQDSKNGQSSDAKFCGQHFLKFVRGAMVKQMFYGDTELDIQTFTGAECDFCDLQKKTGVYVSPQGVMGGKGGDDL